MSTHSLLTRTIADIQAELDDLIFDLDIDRNWEDEFERAFMVARRDQIEERLAQLRNH